MPEAPNDRAPDTEERGSHLFLSYSRADESLVQRLDAAIRRHDWNTWRDRASIPSASEWMAEIRRGIELADGFVFVVTPHSLASRMCRVELSIAVDLSKRLLPLWALQEEEWKRAERLVRENTEPPPDLEVPPELAELDYIEIRDFLDRPQPFDALVDELIEAASRDLAWLRRHTRLQQDVKRWVDSHYGASALLRGALLEDAEGMLGVSDKDPALTELQREFIEESRREFRRLLEREASQLAARILDLPVERTAVGVMLALEGRETYVSTPKLEGTLRTLLSRWPQRALLRHDGPVTSAAFSGGGRYVVTASLDGYARIFDASNGRLLRQIGDGSAAVSRAIFRADRGSVATACADGRVRVVDVATGAGTEVTIADTAVVDMALRPEGDTIVAAAGRVPVLIDLEQFQPYGLPEHPDSIRSVALMPDGKVVTTCADGCLRVIDPLTGESREMSWPDTVVNDARVSPDGSWLALTGTFDGVRLVDPSGQNARSLEGGGSALPIAISGDGTRVAAGDIWGRVFVWDVKTGELLIEQLVFPRFAQALALSSDGALLAAASDDGYATVLRVREGVESRYPGHDRRIRCVELDPAGKRLLTAGEDGTARVFDVDGWPGRTTIRHDTAGVLRADISADGSLVVTTGNDGTVRVFETLHGAELGSFGDPAAELRSATFVPGDEEIAVAFGDGRVVFIDTRTAKEIRSLNARALETHQELRVTTDRQWIGVLAFGELERVISPEDGRDVEDLSPGLRERIAEDLSRQTGGSAPAFRIVHGDGAPALPCVQPDGEDDRIRLDAPDIVVQASLSPDGSVVVGATLNRPELYVFDSRTGEHTATLFMGHKANGVRFSRDGASIVATWLNDVSVLWYPSSEVLLGIAKGQVHRTLTDAERREFGLPLPGSPPPA